MSQGVFLKSCLEPQLLHHADRPVHVLDLLWNILCVFVLTLIVAGLSVVCVCVCVCAACRCGQKVVWFAWERWGLVGWFLTHPTQDHCSAPAVKRSRPQLQVWRGHPGTLPFLSTCDQRGQAGPSGAVWGFWASARVHFIRCTLWIYCLPRTKTHYCQSYKYKCPSFNVFWAL